MFGRIYSLVIHRWSLLIFYRNSLVLLVILVIRTWYDLHNSTLINYYIIYVIICNFSFQFSPDICLQIFSEDEI